jgi:hypothetical protein
MSISFENNNDIIVYAFEKVISYARNNHLIFVAQCAWSLASIIGLEQELIIHIDYFRKLKVAVTSEDCSGIVHSDRTQQIISEKAVSPIPTDLREDRRLDQILENAEEYIEEFVRARSNWHQGRVNPLPQTKRQLRKARKVKDLQEAGKKIEAEGNQRLQEIRAMAIRTLCNE